MLSKRIIICLDVREGKTTKGIRFQGNIDVGDPVAMARNIMSKVPMNWFFTILRPPRISGTFLSMWWKMLPEIYLSPFPSAEESERLMICTAF